jgi:transposase
MSKSPVISSQSRPMGRRPRLMERTVMERVAEAIGAGLSASATADYAGIGRSTYFEWMRRGREAEKALDAGLSISPAERPFLDFMVEIRRIQATSEVESLAVIDRAACGGNWRAAAWFLERSFPDKWGPAHRRKAEPEPIPPVDWDELERKIAKYLGTDSTDPCSQ